MKISDVELYLLEGSVNRPPSHGRSLIVRLVGSDDCQGWGEAPVAWQPEELPGRRDGLLAALTGRSAYDIEEMSRISWLSSPQLWAAVEMACWDLLGRAAKLPLACFWGGVYRNHVPVAVRLPHGSPQESAASARELLTDGYATQIITSCGAAQRDLALVEAVRDAVGPQAELLLDAKKGLATDVAVEHCRRLEPYHLRYIIDPLKTDDFAALASLARQTPVPLATGRGLQSPGDAATLLRSGAPLAASIDPFHVGGLWRSREMVAVAGAGQLPTWLSIPRSAGLASAAVLQLAAATPVLSGSQECGLPDPADDVLRDPLEVISGEVAVPQGPGLGVDVDRAKLERFQMA